MKNNKKWKILWGGSLAAVWTGLLFLFIKTHGVLSLEQILSFQPDSKIAAVLVMLGLFLLKSVDFLLYSPILYAAGGIMFPLFPALCLNLVGIALILTVPYLAGKALGSPVVEQLLEKHPKLQAARKLSNGSEVMIAVLLRAIGIPLHVASVYMGAAQYPYEKFPLGSVLGLLPEMLAFTVMGMSASDASSPAFRIALAAKLLITAASVIIYAIVRRRKADCASR